MKMVTKAAWAFIHTETLQSREFPAGEYLVERRMVLVNRTGVEWLCIVGEPYGASVLSWLSWSPGMRRTLASKLGPAGGVIDWRNLEIRVHDDEGRLLDEHGNPAKEVAS